MAIKIFIDQGHNPVNPNAGAESSGVREQDVNFQVGVRLAALLNANPDFEARLSRPEPDTQLGNTTTVSSLRARVDAANSWPADYFISLHCNANTNVNISGTEGYVFALGTPAAEMAEEILEGISDMTGLRDRGVYPRPTLFVLRETAMPAALIELGYLTNAGDRALLVNDPESFARGIYNGLIDFLDMDSNR